MASSLWNYIVIDESSASHVYVATSIENVLESIDYSFTPIAIIRTTLYSGVCNDYGNVLNINRRDT